MALSFPNQLCGLDERPLMHRTKNLLQRGSISIEVTLVLPFLIITYLLITQFVFLVFAKRSAQISAEQGAEEAAYYQANNADGYAAAKDAAIQVSGLKNVEIQIERDGSNVTAIVSGSPVKLLPLPMKVSAEVSAPIEQVLPQEARQ